ncbi:3'-5' exonuclease [Herbaspirillum sp. meg3]|uniref:3'-5' exonuclease n=1 Tax=Herbaspirillum sp. meg3 TaxID=2025949 RepID=UPI000B98BCB0|nr:3'-5' exonuclease [Herbaspirillum sp. meg3]ASU38159.1 3'-5' exonuclease [Herbaspirillum sp. meg3]
MTTEKPVSPQVSDELRLVSQGTYLIVDLEATCSDDGSISEEQMQIVEFGAVFLNSNLEIIDTFQSFVRPSQTLVTSFCTQLTGITQEQVDSAPTFLIAALALQKFVEKYRTSDSMWLSWGAWDAKQLARESLVHGVENPIQLPHQNAKRLFAKTQKLGKQLGMAKACDLTGLGIEGAHHRALDDALNVARLLPWILGMQRLKDKT